MMTVTNRIRKNRIKAIHTGVWTSPNQSAQQLQRNLVNLSPSQRVDSKLLRTELTLESWTAWSFQDWWFWFLDKFNVFVFGKDINAKENIVYLNFSALASVALGYFCIDSATWSTCRLCRARVGVDLNKINFSLILDPNQDWIWKLKTFRRCFRE
jgi:hypothetical protein